MTPLQLWLRIRDEKVESKEGEAAAHERASPSPWG
jgi:hypothetical protein